MAPPQAKAQPRGQASQLKRVVTQPASNDAPGLPHVHALRVEHVASVSGARVNAALHSDLGISQSELTAAIQIGTMLKVVSNRMEVYGIISELRILDSPSKATASKQRMVDIELLGEVVPSRERGGGIVFQRRVSIYPSLGSHLYTTTVE